MPKKSKAEAARVAELETLGALTEPVRRALYDFVVAADQPMGRDAAAKAIGIGRSLAAFHLDRLVDARLLTTSYRRLSGRSGPGAGRPSKLYERAAGEHGVSVPPRRYDLAAELLAQAVEVSAASRAQLVAAARQAGEGIGNSAPPRTDAVSALRDQGFEPRGDESRVELANCPFHAVATTHTELVCGANLAFVEGLLAGLGEEARRAVLDAAPGRCCVVLLK